MHYLTKIIISGSFNIPSKDYSELWTLDDLVMENGLFSHLRWNSKSSWKTNLEHDQILSPD
jgi:hypothetical protein